MAGMTTRELLEKLYNQDYEKLKGKKLRMTRVRVPGKEVCLAHVINPSQSCTLEPRVNLPLSASISPLMIFNMVVLPVPLLPIRATRSPRLISKEMSLKSVCPGKDLERLSTVRTSFPLTNLGSREMRI